MVATPENMAHAKIQLNSIAPVTRYQSMFFRPSISSDAPSP